MQAKHSPFVDAIGMGDTTISHRVGVRGIHATEVCIVDVCSAQLWSTAAIRKQGLVKRS